ncbi:phosphatase PAP2 family protein [Acidisoma sp. L85]|uniref:phosphatase PAP2 family protein n=1 Tax=Acidisoma sp. L85 TaxID=1641850 RepID=UPI00131AC922|nr:phosphatase PAP2 family protein [Acidisoma sp. L85]
MYELLTVITGVGDSAAMLPAGAGLMLWLVINGMRRDAVLLFAVLGAGAAVVLATKLAFLGWGLGIPALRFAGISGHAMLACSIMPIAAYFISRRAGVRTRIAAALLGFAVGVAIGISRVALSAHSWSEIVAGCALGGLVALVYLRFAWLPLRAAFNWWPIIGAGATVLIAALAGVRAPSEHLIVQMALHLSRHDEPYARPGPVGAAASGS